MNGMLSQKTLSKAFPTEWALPWWEELLLLGSGALAVAMHRNLDFMEGAPGHHGIEWMALLIIGRACSRFRGAGSLTSVGASFASLMPFWRGGDPFIPLLYLLPGPVMDLAFRYLPRYAEKIWFMMLLGGLANMTKPLMRLVINLLAGWPFGSFRFGVAYPVVSHLFYGAFGGLLGALIIFGVNRLSAKNNSKG